MPRVTYVQVGTELYLKGTEPGRSYTNEAPAIIGDQADLVSPVDGKLYSGRAGLREHNARNDVIDNRDLVGLPTMMSNSDFRSAEQKRASAQQRKEIIINEVNKHYR